MSALPSMADMQRARSKSPLCFVLNVAIWACVKALSSGDVRGDKLMHSHSIEDFRHAHVFLGQAHERNERKTWTVIAICTAMMVAEIVGGLLFGSVALVADGLHMSTMR